VHHQLKVDALNYLFD